MHCFAAPHSPFRIRPVLLALAAVLLLAAHASAQDTDGDGMPDAWENTYGLNPTSTNDANYDLDSDWLKNLAEYQNDCIPTNIDTDVNQYPDSGKFGVVAGCEPGMRVEDAPFGGFFSEDGRIDYWEGE